MSDVRFALAQEVDAISTLLLGYLPIHFVSPTLLQRRLNNISDRHTSTQFRLVYTDPVPYYHLKDILYTRQDDYLYVTLKVPITSLETSFIVNRVRSFPVLLETDPMSYSVITLASYFGLSKDNRFYILLTEDEYRECEGNVLKRCLHGYSIQSVTHKSCKLGLFRNDLDMIHNLCKFKVIVGPPPTSILPISESSFLVSTTDTRWEEQCFGTSPKFINPCRLCLVTLPCHCSILTESFVLPAPFGDCVNSSTSEIVPSYNFPALLSFYQNRTEFNTVLDRIRSQNTSFKFSGLRIIDKKFKNVLSTFDEQGFRLNETMTHLKKNKVAYNDKVSALADNLGFIALPEFNIGNHAFLLLVSVISTSALIISCRNFFLLSALSRPVLSMDYSGNELLSSQSCHLFSVSNIIDYVGWFVLVLLLVIILSYICRPPKQYSVHPELPVSKFCLTFFGKRDSVTVPVHVIPLPLDEIFFHNHGIFKLPCIHYGLRGVVIHTNWDFITLKIKFSGKPIPLPGKSVLPFSVGLRVTQILKQLDFVQFAVNHGSSFLDLGTWSAEDIRSSIPLQEDGVDKQNFPPPVSVKNPSPRSSPASPTPSSNELDDLLQDPNFQPIADPIPLVGMCNGSLMYAISDDAVIHRPNDLIIDLDILRRYLPAFDTLTFLRFLSKPAAIEPRFRFLDTRCIESQLLSVTSTDHNFIIERIHNFITIHK